MPSTLIVFLLILSNWIHLCELGVNIVQINTVHYTREFNYFVWQRNNITELDTSLKRIVTYTNLTIYLFNNDRKHNIPDL